MCWPLEGSSGAVIITSSATSLFSDDQLCKPYVNVDASLEEDSVSLLRTLSEVE